MSRRVLLSGTTGTLLLCAALSSAAAIFPATLHELSQTDSIESNPLRLWMNERLVNVDGDTAHFSVLQAICERGDGFRAQDLPGDKDIQAEILISLVQIGFLEPLI